MVPMLQRREQGNLEFKASLGHLLGLSPKEKKNKVNKRDSPLPQQLFENIGGSFLLFPIRVAQVVLRGACSPSCRVQSAQVVLSHWHSHAG